MAKISCFSALLAGRRRKRVVADGNKLGGTADCPKVKPVEFTDAPPVAAPGFDKFGDEVTRYDVKGGDDVNGGDMAPVTRDCCSDDFHGGEEEEAEAEAEAESSAKLKRSCSNIETKRTGPRDADEMPARSRSYGDLADLPARRGAPEASPASVKTSRTADGVMLKKRSSSQVLPSRSRKLWWRLFMWSHRNLHRPWSAHLSGGGGGAPSRHRGGYTSDTIGEDPVDSANRKNKNVMTDESPPPPVPTQWVAFSAENSLDDRVGAWMKSIGEEDDDSVARPRHLEPSGKPKRCAAADEVAQASSIIQSLNTVSSVAHIAGMGLKVVPIIAPFSSLRAVNLSGNFIVHISPGSLPKGLHSLDLSRNKIATMDGLRELTKLRVLNLSYNRISRIGHGLSNCTAMRELYMAGNKVSDVEGLHRLLKLAVLDLGFNRVTTAKALGQLVANYHSLRALNLVGNPVHANTGDDALRKAVTGLLPNLAYLNKQPVKPQRARELATDSVARAALAGGGSLRRRASRRLMQSPGPPAAAARSRSKGRQQHGSSH